MKTKKIVLSKKKWESLQNKKTAGYSDSGFPDDTDISQKDSFDRHLHNKIFSSIIDEINDITFDSDFYLDLEEKTSMLSGWIANSIK